MSDSTVGSGNEITIWADDHMVEYVRMNPLNDLAGPSDENIIHVKEDLSKEAGTSIRFQLVGSLDGDGVEDGAQLMDNEEVLDQYGYTVTVHELRNGIRRGEYEQQKTTIDMLRAGKTALRKWSADKQRDLWIARMLSPNTDGVSTYAATSEASRDAWVVANNPTTSNIRIVCGAAKSNLSADHSDGLANIDGTADDLHPDLISLIKRAMKTCSPRITPYKLKDGGEEWFVLLAGSIAFRDLQANMSTIHQNAAPRSMEENPLFRDRDIVYDGMIVKEVPEMSRVQSAKGAMISGVGAGSINVEATFACGAQAVCHAIAKRPSVREDDKDYQNLRGVAIVETRGAGKATYNSIQTGMGTLYVSAVGD